MTLMHDAKAFSV